MKNQNEIELFLLTNEPVFELDGVQYSVCCPIDNQFSTWDSNGNTYDFQGINNLLDNWVVAGRPFRDIVDEVFPL